MLPTARCTSNVRHPTYPESASRSGTITKADAFAKLCASWNQDLEVLHGVVTPDAAVPRRPYGAKIVTADLAAIPARDLPPGLPDWMTSLDAWAVRADEIGQLKRATITVTVPTNARRWPVLVD